MSRISQQIENHYLANLGVPLDRLLRTIVDSTLSLTLGIYKAEDRLVFATNGLSSIRLVNPDDERLYHAELLLYVPLDWDIESMKNGDPIWAWPVDWMRRIALWHAQKQFWFGRGDAADDLTDFHSLDRPLAGYLACLYLTEGPPLGTITLSDELQIAFYTMYPLYDTEYALLHSSGAASLLQAFRDSGISTITSQLRSPVA